MDNQSNLVLLLYTYIYQKEPTFDECMTLWDCTYDVSYYGSGYIDITINTPYDFHLRERLPSSCCHVEMYTRDIKPCVVVFTNKWFEEYTIKSIRDEIMFKRNTPYFRREYIRAKVSVRRNCCRVPT